MSAVARTAAAAVEPSSSGRLEAEDRNESFFGRNDVAFLFHLAALVFYVRTWAWHCTPAALGLPGAHGFGWFFRYLTFCSYTLQLVQLFFCCAAHLVRNPKRKRRLAHVAEVLSCAAFGIANTVTALFFAVENTTQGLVEGGAAHRPAWLNLSVHVLNSVVAWGDLLVAEERAFHGRSRHVAVAFGLAYSAWVLVVRHYFGKFPYPILNKLPFPWGFVGFFGTGMAIILGVLELGRFVKHRALAALADGHARRRAARRALKAAKAA
eukprot:scaffold20.g7786.t1